MTGHIICCIAFIIQMICFPACLSTDIRRTYGRIFNTRIDTKIYHVIFYSCAILVCILFVLMQFGVIV